MGTAFDVLVLVTCVGSGLVGGAFFVFSVMVMPALRKLVPAEGIRAMQAINAAAIRPLFMVVFIGTAALSLGLGVWSATGLDEPGTLLTLIACAAYLFGCFLLTTAYHVPRNNALLTVDAGMHESAAKWQRYQREWTRMNHVRALASAASAVLLAIAV